MAFLRHHTAPGDDVGIDLLSTFGLMCLDSLQQRIDVKVGVGFIIFHERVQSSREVESRLRVGILVAEQRRVYESSAASVRFDWPGNNGAYSNI